ncbi:hypothetical protein [Amycolatopsis sp. NPDC051371]|uniref:hypothetical protein n=1 Tax=Amycolatopsis sp. NPDC051371 TaxID=3155800 RepID=UPI0034239402
MLIRLAHTAQLPAAELAAVRALLEGAFTDFDLPGWVSLDLDGELIADWRAGDVW